MAEPIWEKMFRGEHVSIAMEDLTVHRMREVKAELGADYGSPAQIWQGLMVGDMDAVAVALWIHGQVIGRPVGNLLELDFNPTEFENPPEKPKRPKKKPDPTPAATEAETTSSETSTSSEDDSSSS